MLDQGALINDLDKVDDILVLGFRDVIVYLEEFFDVFELCVVLNEMLEDAFVLLVTDFDKVLSFKDRSDLRVELRVKYLVDDHSQLRCKLGICMVESQGIVHDVGKKHFQNFILSLDDWDTGFKELSPTLLFNLSYKVETKTSVVSRTLHGTLISLKEVLIVRQIAGRIASD